jgi:hypothetical protein
MAWSRLTALFRRLLSSRCRTSATEPDIAESIAPGESFTRFICSSGHFASTKGRVKAQALLPKFNALKGQWETSVHRPLGLSDAQTWALGYSHVERVGENRVIKARGTGLFDLIAGAGLQVEVNGPPFPRHVDIKGWSPSDKADRLMRATEIADKLQLQLDPRKTVP